MDQTVGVTKLLQDAAKGDGQAQENLAPIVLDKLRAIAQQAMVKERRDHTLQPTLLADEAFLKLVGQEDVDWECRTQFYAFAAISIRRLLVDHARAHNAMMWGGHRDRLAMETMDQFGGGESQKQAIDVLDLDDALDELKNLNERQARIVELKFFGSLTVKQIAHVLDVSPRLVDGDWAMARAWLRQKLETNV